MIFDDGGMATDPVCGMQVTPASAQHTVDHEGTVHYFCGPRCRKAFNANPAKFLDPAYKASKMSGLRAIIGGVFGRS
jgi:Cu+-exporting ATPase